MGFVKTEHLCRIAKLHTYDIDELPRVNVYKCYVEFDNGVIITEKIVVVFAEKDVLVPGIVNNILCKHNDDSILSIKVKRIDIELNDGFEIVDK